MAWPAEAPAVAVTCATPLKLVTAEVAESVTGPVAANVTVTPLINWPLLSLTTTASGFANAVPSTADWLLPLWMVRLAKVALATVNPP